LADVSNGRTDQEIAAVAELACSALRSGTTPEELVALVRSLGSADATTVDEATARELVKLAIDRLCVDQAAQIDNY